MRRSVAVLALAAALGLLAGCSDDGGQVRSDGGGSGSGSGGSGSGLSASDLGSQSSNAEITTATNAYKTYVQGEVTALRTATKKFTDAVRAGNVAEAKKQFAPSRVSWERIEPIAGLVEEIDGAVDARVDDFAGPGDPAFTGWHRLEYILFSKNTTAGAKRFADGLDRNLASLKNGLAALEIPPAAVAQGASELIQEVSEGKITGEEDRYSKTDLWDFNANVEGSQKVISLLSPALQTADPALLAKIQAGFADLDAGLAPLRKGSGWVLFCQVDDEFPSPRCPKPTVTPAQIDAFKAQLGGLAEDLALVPGALGLS